MLTNYFLQDQIDFNLIQTNIIKSISKRFIIKKNVQFIHDSFNVKVTSNWEERLISDTITLAYQRSIKELYYDKI